MSPICGQRVWVSQRTCAIVTKSGIKSVKFEPAIPTEYMTMAGPVHVRTGPATPFKTTRRTSTRQRKRPRGSLRLASGKIGPVRGHRRMGHRQGGKVCGEKGVWGGLARPIREPGRCGEHFVSHAVPVLRGTSVPMPPIPPSRQIRPTPSTGKNDIYYQCDRGGMRRWHVLLRGIHRSVLSGWPSGQAGFARDRSL